MREYRIQRMQIEGFTEKEYGMVRLENAGDVLFQALLLDSVKGDISNNMYAELITILLC